MKRVLLFLCGLCWIVAGIVAGVFGCRFLFDSGDSQTSILQILEPVSSGSVLLGLIHVVGFCALSGFCFLIGIGLCSYIFDQKRDDDVAA
jgi:hypothetical protein